MSPPQINNTLMDDHPQAGNEYLADIHTSPIGRYHAHSYDPQQIFTIKAETASDGQYSVQMYDKDGTYSQSIYNGHKHAADSMSHIVTNHKHTGYGQGHSENIGTGHFKQNAGTSSKATDGPNIHSSNLDKMALSASGKSIHASNDDHARWVNSGGNYHGGDKGHGSNIKGSMNMSVSQDVNWTVGTNEAHVLQQSWSVDATQNMVENAGQNITTTAGQKITITAGTEIDLIVGSSSIKITSGKIVLTSGEIDFNQS